MNVVDKPQVSIDLIRTARRTWAQRLST